MKRITIGLMLGLSLAFGLALLPGTAWAWGSHAFHPGLHRGVRHGHGGVFIGHRHRVVHHQFRIHHHPQFTRHGFNHHLARLHRVRKPVWIPGFLHWNGFGGVWVPGHRAR